MRIGDSGNVIVTWDSSLAIVAVLKDCLISSICPDSASFLQPAHYRVLVSIRFILRRLSMTVRNITFY